MNNNVMQLEFNVEKKWDCIILEVFPEYGVEKN
jgi:hypothetical protein